MMIAISHTIFFTILLLVTTAEAAKILAILPYPAKSHVGAFQPLFEELAQRGHQMTVITPFPRTKPLANYTEIIYEDTLRPRDAAGINFFELNQANSLFMMSFLYKMLTGNCENLIKQPNVQKLIHSTDLEFDLIIYEPHCAECTYGLLHKFKAPSIQIVPNTITSWGIDSMGNPNTISYIPDVMSQTHAIDFKARLFSVLGCMVARILVQNIYHSRMDSIMREHFPDPTIPSIYDLLSNSSFLFLHTHPILNYPRPLTPNTIEVGGLHITNKQNISTEMQKFLDDAPYGVIYFSLGSNVRSVDMPEKMRNAILKSFSKLKQKVLWKWEADSLPGQPKNVRLGKWLPQHGILAHPNIKLFITHGGLMSIQEATYYGVPMIAIPVAVDQKFNAIQAQNSGYAVVLEVHNITEESLDWAIHEILHKPRYQEASKYVSRILHDQPQTPMDRAVYWVEYVIRHKGAPHMRSAALHLNFFQYYLLDVITVILVVIITMISALVLLVKVIFKRLFAKPIARKNNSKNKKNK